MTLEASGIRRTRRALNNVVDFFDDDKPMRKVCEGIQERILDLTDQGKDYRGRKFEPYSEGYSKRTGKRRVDLRDTGTMLDSMKIKIRNPRHGQVRIPSRSHPRSRANTRMLANIHNTGTGKQPEREFMNITENWKRKLVKKYFDDPLLKIAKRARF